MPDNQQERNPRYSWVFHELTKDDGEENSYSDDFKILKIRDMSRIFNIIHSIDFKIAFST
jgi:hypothetical protein